MIKENCFWLCVIKGRGGSDYYCEAPYKNNTDFNCENCKKYINIPDMQEFIKQVLKKLRKEKFRIDEVKQ